MLARSARYLQRRTGGMIGSLSLLVRAVTQIAILEGRRPSPASCWTPSPSTTPPSPASMAPPECFPSASGPRRRPSCPCPSPRSRARTPLPTSTGPPSPTSSTPADLRVHLAGRRGHGPVTLDDLAAATGRSQRALARALPELRPGAMPKTDAALPGHVRRTVCWLCAARRDAFPYATVWQPAEACISPATESGSDRPPTRATAASATSAACPRSSRPSGAIIAWRAVAVARQPSTRSPRQRTLPLSGHGTGSTATDAFP
jgi:hypothetical protein